MLAFPPALSSRHADVQFINVNLVEATNRFPHFQSIATSAFVLLGHAGVGEGAGADGSVHPKGECHETTIDGGLGRRSACRQPSSD
jgi:hypothetical protein